MEIENRIFLAHASEDKPQVRQLCDQLKRKGFSPWLDEVDLVGGENWQEEIPKAIRQAVVCLACLSKRSVAKRSYVQKEFRYAMSVYAELPPGSIYLIPVRLDNCEVPDLQLAPLELNLRALHWIDLFKADGFEKLIIAIEKAAPTKQVFSDFEIFRDIDEPWCPEMIMLPAGRFLMGSPEDEKRRKENEGPQHDVTISKPFALGRYPITFAEFDHFCEETGHEKPSDRGWGRRRRPVINVIHQEAEIYCSWLSKITKVATYCLPTEAMWEYACRAGKMTAYAFGNQITAEDQANFSEAVGMTTEVGAYAANDWGLHDMHGNVWEWCADGRRRYSTGIATDPRGPLGTKRVLRGGSWYSLSQGLRSARRPAFEPAYRDDTVGFRCARIQGPVATK